VAFPHLLIFSGEHTTFLEGGKRGWQRWLGKGAPGKQGWWGVW
jgi:hypothetical protein